MRLLHLSDLHFSRDNLSRGQKQIIDALMKDLEEQKKLKHFDCIVISGDISSKGQISGNFKDDFNTHFFQKLMLVATGVPIIVCPGNHDINLSKKPDFLKPVFDIVSSPDKANELYENSSQNPILTQHIQDYLDLAKLIDSNSYNNSQFYYTKIINFDNFKVGIASINSSWLTKGGGQGDYGNLYVSELQIEQAINELINCDLKIAVMHHSYDWINPSESSRIKRIISGNFNAVLCGHNHATNAEGVFTNRGSIFISNTGCLYEHRDYFNGYSILDLNVYEKKWKVQAREYYSQRNEFSISPRFAENGEMEYSFSENSLITEPVVSHAIITEIQDKASSKLLSYIASDIAPKQVGAMFVEPPMATVDEKQFIDSGKNSEKYISLSKIASLNKSAIFIGKRESGKTLLLHEIAANRFTDFSPRAQLGIVVDISILTKNTEASILSAMVEATSSELNKKQILNLLEKGNILVCFDNFSKSDPKSETIIEFCKKFHSVRYIIGSLEELKTSISISQSTPDIGIDCDRFFIHSFKRKHVKALVRNWFGSETSQLNDKFEIVQSLLNQLNVPTTPFLVSVLSWVIEQRPNASMVNQATAIEVLIEGLLEKFQESKSRENFDSAIQMHFLSELAVHMDSCCQEWLDELTFDEFVINYFKSRGLIVSASAFTSELFKKGILYSFESIISFKFDCFRAYFLAKKFTENPSLWQKALEFGNFQKYTSEIDLYTGLHRDKKEVVELSEALCSQLFYNYDIDVDLSEFDKINSSTEIISIQKLDALEGKILGSDYDENTRNHHLEKIERPSVASIDPEMSRKRNNFTNESKELSFLTALRIFSIVIRNSELIDDVEFKKKNFDLSIKYWSKFLTFAMKMLQEIRDDDPNFTKIFGENSSAEKNRQLALLLFPQIIIALMEECLFTPKLIFFLEEEENSKLNKELESQKSILRIMKSVMLIEYWDSSTSKKIKNLLTEFQNNKNITQIIFFRLLHLYTTKNLRNSYIKEIRECLSDAFTSLKGKTRIDSINKDKFLLNLDKKREDFNQSKKIA